MSKKYPGGIIKGTPVVPTATSASGIWTTCQAINYTKQGLWPRSPGTPTIGTATISGTTASVPFTAPTDTGSASITTYTATSTPGCITGTAASSPISVSGLTGGTSYTFKVKATNGAGTGPCSAASNSVTAQVIGQQAYTTAGTYTWVVPTGVTSVSVVAIAGGNGGGIGGGAGGGVGYRNNISVTPGNSITVVVGAGGTGRGAGTNCTYGNKGGNSTFNGTVVVATSGCNTSTCNNSGGSFSGTCVSGYKGGKTFGYFGYATKGGDAGNNADGQYQANQYGGGTTAGAGSPGGVIGGAGGGGSGTGVCYCVPGGGGGGGSGLGYAGTSSNGASGGVTGANGGAYGGGGGGANADAAHNGGTGARGAVRIIWPGTTRAFPSTCVGNF